MNKLHVGVLFASLVAATACRQQTDARSPRDSSGAPAMDFTDPHRSHTAAPDTPSCTTKLLVLETPLEGSFEHAMDKAGDVSEKATLHIFSSVGHDVHSANSVPGFAKSYDKVSAVYTRDRREFVTVAGFDVSVFAAATGNLLHQIHLPKPTAGLVGDRSGEKTALARAPNGDFWLLQGVYAGNRNWQRELRRIDGTGLRTAEQTQVIPLIEQSGTTSSSDHMFARRADGAVATEIYMGRTISRGATGFAVEVSRLSFDKSALVETLLPVADQDSSSLVDLWEVPGSGVVALWAELVPEREYYMRYRVSHWNGKRWTLLAGDFGIKKGGISEEAAMIVTPRGELVLAVIETQFLSPHERDAIHLLRIYHWQRRQKSWVKVAPNLGGGLSMLPGTYKTEPRLWIADDELYLSWIEETELQGYAPSDLGYNLAHEGEQDEAKLRRLRTHATDVFTLRYAEGRWVDVDTSRTNRAGKLGGLSTRHQLLPLTCQ